MFNLIYYQVAVQICCTLTESECDQIVDKYSADDKDEFNNLGTVMAFVLRNLDKCKHLRAHDLSMPVTASTSAATSVEAIPSTSFTSSSAASSLHSLEQQLQKLCLPFLRVAALLRHHIYAKVLPDIRQPQMEFVQLVYYLELMTENTDWNSFNATKALNFLPGYERVLPKSWCDQVMRLRETDQTAGQKNATIALLSKHHILWQQPKLLTLPHEYEKLFTVRLN